MIKDYLNKDLAAKNKSKSALTARLEEINKRTAELAEINERSCDEKELKATAEELDKLKGELAEKQAELAGLEAEIKELEKLIADADKPAEDNPANDGQPQRKQFLNYEKRGQKTMTIEERLEQAKKFVETKSIKKETEETRALLISSGTIATPTGVDGTIRDTFNHVPSIVDMVEIVNCEGMGAYKVAYEKAISTANTTTEGQAYNSSDPQYDYITLQPTTVTVLSQISKQVMKQTPLNYQTKVEDSAYKALRMKAANLITSAIVASELNTAVNITVTGGVGVIDDKTLRNIVLNYGTNETVIGEAVLQLTKADLIAFGDVRSDTTLQAVYEIIPDTANPNTGIIKDGGLAVRYILNPNLTAIGGTAQPASSASSIVGMLYGQPNCCTLALFSGYDVMVSEDYAFNTGMLTIRGDVEMDADVTKLGGFVAVTLPKATE